MNKILVIEDNHAVRENICEILELANYQVDSAENGKAGIIRIKENRPDLILCDVTMPILDGFGVLKILNDDDELKYIPFIFLSAKSERSDIRKAMGLGAEDYLTKPFEDVELLETVKLRLAKHAHHRKTNTAVRNKIDRKYTEEKFKQKLFELVRKGELRKFRKKENVYQEGQIARWIYYVQEGQVRQYITNNEGKVFTNKLCTTGDYFGLFSLYQSKRYGHAVGCIRDSEIICIPKDIFLSQMKMDVDFQEYFIRLLAYRIEYLEQSSARIAYNTVRQKVANALLMLMDHQNNLSEDNHEMTMTRDELASISGTAKETLIRTLSDFKNENVIELKGKSIIIKDKSKLIKISE